MEEALRELPTAVEEVMQREGVVKSAEIQHVKVMKTADVVMQHEEAEKTA